MRTRYIDRTESGEIRDYTETDKKGGLGRNAEVDLREYLTGKLEACHRDFDSDAIIKRGVTLEIKTSGGTLDYGLRYNGDFELAKSMLAAGDFRIGNTYIAYVEEYRGKPWEFRIMTQKRWIELALKHGMLYVERDVRHGYNIRVRNPKTCNQRKKEAWAAEREMLSMTPDELLKHLGLL